MNHHPEEFLFGVIFYGRKKEKSCNFPEMWYT